MTGRPWLAPKVFVARTAMAADLLPHLEPVPAERLAPALPGLRWPHLTGTGTYHLAAGLAPGALVTTSRPGCPPNPSRSTPSRPC
ncbi:hypothetical protein ACH4C2_00300 [Streptomyces sp. NPDC018057]|uniref:hypothetical protein n=1 Tax=unclassified Streptomyces TaxID=2593676 RepID=UPI003791C08E